MDLSTMALKKQSRFIMTCIGCLARLPGGFCVGYVKPSLQIRPNGVDDFHIFFHGCKKCSAAFSFGRHGEEERISTENNYKVFILLPS